MKTRSYPYRLILCLMIFSLSGLLSSCSEESADAGYFSKEFRLDFATVNLEDKTPVLYLDNRDTLRLSAESAFRFSRKKGQRVIVNHSPTAIRSISDIFTSQIYTAKPDTIHKDAVKIQSIWLGGEYLNIILDMNYYSKPHRFGLFRSPDSPNTLQLSHDRQGDSEGYPVRVYLSFFLNGLYKPQGGLMPFSVKIPTWGGLQEYPFTSQ